MPTRLKLIWQVEACMNVTFSDIKINNIKNAESIKKHTNCNLQMFYSIIANKKLKID